MVISIRNTTMAFMILKLIHGTNDKRAKTISTNLSIKVESK